MRSPEFSVRLEGEELSFDASHFITLRFGEKGLAVEPIHTHRFRVTAEITGPLNKESLLLDFHAAHRVLSEILDECRGKLFLALHQQGVTVRRKGDLLEATFETASSKSGKTTPACHKLNQNEVILLDAGNGSAEMIVLFLARRFLGGLEDAGLLPAGKEAYRLRLSLEEAPGMKAVVIV
ncbi:MAG: 6-carboxytetrahydropterin synthase [Thermoguttaceae bacterium]|jgi:6-pyruvoyl-tetrahydropterin synthase